MLDIEIIAFGKLKDKACASLASEYCERAHPYARIKITELEAAPFSEDNHTKAKAIEGARLENCLNRKSGRNIYLLTERGKPFDSSGFASFLEEEAPLTLVIGGALGFSDNLYKAYPGLSLSALTFPHELARVLLLEQVYRAATIIAGKRYNY